MVSATFRFGMTLMNFFCVTVIAVVYTILTGKCFQLNMNIKLPFFDSLDLIFFCNTANFVTRIINGFSAILLYTIQFNRHGTIANVRFEGRVCPHQPK